jgi:hypothetical protein
MNGDIAVKWIASIFTFRQRHHTIPLDSPEDLRSAGAEGGNFTIRQNRASLNVKYTGDMNFHIERACGFYSIGKMGVSVGLTVMPKKYCIDSSAHDGGNEATVVRLTIHNCRLHCIKGSAECKCKYVTDRRGGGGAIKLSIMYLHRQQYTKLTINPIYRRPPNFFWILVFGNTMLGILLTPSIRVFICGIHIWSQHFSSSSGRLKCLQAQGAYFKWSKDSDGFSPRAIMTKANKEEIEMPMLKKT